MTQLALPRWMETMPWAELDAVGIRTSGQGPFVEDMFWQFLVRDGLVEVPNGAMTGDAFSELGRRLAGFDYTQVIAASGSILDRWFSVWDRELPVVADRKQLAARFDALITRLGGRPLDTFTASLLARWTEPARRYHNAKHLASCLYELDAAGGGDAIELALWYHDAIYEAGAPDCEARSAELLRRDASALGIDADHAAALVRATAHTAAVADPATELILDIDLSILGAGPLRFLDYDYAIEEEYAAFQPATFRAGRARFLAELLARPRLFRTAAFHARYEERARRSIAALLAGPRYRVTSDL